MADAEVIRYAFRHPEPYAEGDPNCPGCRAEVELLALEEERAVLAAALQRIVDARWNVSRANMIGIAQNALRNNGG